MQFDYFYGNEAEQFTFYRIPKVLVSSPRFRKVSDSAKLLYGLMLDRMALSVRNGWFDENNRAYIYFTTKEIMETMCCATEKATKIVAELDSKKGIGLIERIKQGQGKPAKIYLKKFVGVCSETAAESRVSKTENQELRAADTACDSRAPRVSKIENQGFCTAENRIFENRNSSVSISESEDFRNSKCNNTDISDTEYSNTEIKSYHIPEQKSNNSGDDAMRWMEKRRAYENIIKKNIDYDIIVNDYGREWLDEIVAIMVDTVCSDAPTIRINRQDFPQETVKSRLLKLNASHIEYLYFALKNNKSDVRNIHAFLITAIYRSYDTANNWYSAKVNHDMYEGARRNE